MYKESKFINESDSNIIEIVFDYAAVDTILKTDLKNNSIYLFENDFSMGNLNDINIPLKLPKDKKVRIWSSRSIISEYLNFIYLCNKLDNNISVVFVNEYSHSISLAGSLPEEISDLLKYEKELSKEEQKEYKQEWLNLININSELRLFEKGKVINVNYEYLKNFINNVIKENDIKGKLSSDNSMFIGTLMGHDINNKLKEDVWKEIIEKLGY